MTTDREQIRRDAEWMERLREKYPDDALERLVRSGYDYYSTHGDYLPELAKLLLVARSELAQADTKIASLNHRAEQAERERDEALLNEHENAEAAERQRQGRLQAERERDALKARWEADNLCGICPYRQSIQTALVQAERERDEALERVRVNHDDVRKACERAEQAYRERDELKARQGRDALNGPAPSDRRSPFGTRGLTDE